MKALDFLINLKHSGEFDGNIEYSLDESLAELEEWLKKYKALCEDLIDERKIKAHLLQSFKKQIEKLEALESRSCVWELQDDEYSIYETQCKHGFLVVEGTPANNNFKYCPYCGGKIKCWVGA